MGVKLERVAKRRISLLMLRFPNTIAMPPPYLDLHLLMPCNKHDSVINLQIIAEGVFNQMTVKLQHVDYI
jgi:hypothetical protein